MNQEKWTQQLHDKLAEYETAAPDDLWDDIESVLNGQQKRRARIIALRRWTVAAAAAVAVIVVTVVGTRLFWNDKMYEMGEADHELLVETPEVPVHEVIGQKPKARPSAPNQKLLAAAELPKQTAKLAEDMSHPPVLLKAVEPTEESGPDQVSPKPLYPQAEQSTDCMTPKGEAEAVRFISLHAGRKKSLKPSFSLYTMNTFGSHDNSNAVIMADALARNYTKIYTAGGDVAGSRQGTIYLTDYEEHQHHSQPIAFGISVAYPLNSRLSLTSGVVYTKLESMFTQTIHSQHIQQEQVLHYVGIPLGVSYRLWEYGRFKTYLAAGVQADWNVSAHLNTEGVEQTMHRDRMQWSASGSLGLQYDALPPLSLYAEPGINYHFDNGSVVQNFFKDKPTNLKLQIGVRLNIGN